MLESAKKELQSIYDCLNEPDLSKRATLYETYSRLLQVGREDEDIRHKLIGRIVSDEALLDDVMELIEIHQGDDLTFDSSITLQRIQNIIVGMNGRIDLHFINDCGVVADIRIQVLDFIKKLMEG